MLFNKKSEIDDLFDFNGVKMKTFTQWNRLRHGPMERTEIMKNVTLKDVAKAAGVSYATVSRALSGSNQIGKSTRERIVRLWVHGELRGPLHGDEKDVSAGTGGAGH